MDFDQSPKTAKKVDRIQLKIPKIWCIEQKLFGTNHYSRNLIFLTMQNLFPY